MDIGITGASGLLGAALCRQLVREDHSLRGLIHTNKTSLEGLPIQLVSGNLTDTAALDKLCKGTDVLFHLAGQISIGQVSEAELWNTNVEGTAAVISACQRAKVRRLVYFSSVHAYAAVPTDRVFDEMAPPAHAFPYERTKAAAQKLVLEANGQAGLETICLNPTSVLGPWDFKPSLQGQMLLDLLAGRIPVLSPGGFDWVDSRDIANAAVAAIHAGRPGEAYMLSGQYVTLRELAQIIGRVSGKPMPRQTLPFWFLKSLTPLISIWSRVSGQAPLFTRESLSHVERGHPNVSHAKASRDLAYAPRPLEETVRDMYNWFLEHYLT